MKLEWYFYAFFAMYTIYVGVNFVYAYRESKKRYSNYQFEASSRYYPLPDSVYTLH